MQIKSYQWLGRFKLIANSAQSRVKKSKDLGAFRCDKLGKIRDFISVSTDTEVYRFLLMLKSAQ